MTNTNPEPPPPPLITQVCVMIAATEGRQTDRYGIIETLSRDGDVIVDVWITEALLSGIITRVCTACFTLLTHR